MRTEVFSADTIDDAAGVVLYWLKEDPDNPRSISSRNNVFYFDGWDGLGASAVLRAVAQRLSPTSEERHASASRSNVPVGLEFDQVMHIDCSKWENRRALQRAVAEQLELPAEVMKMFDRQDEEDDFRGVAQDSRKEVDEVTRVMYQHIQRLNHRFLVILHNGGSEEIDLQTSCGFSLSGYSTSKVLWTFQGRYRFKPRVKVDSAMKSSGTTDTFISAVAERSSAQVLWSYLVCQEAEEVYTSHKNNRGPRNSIGQAAQVAECFSYMLQLCCRGHQYQYIDYDLTTHAANYWICDGILKQLQPGEGDDDDDGLLWRAVDALRCEMQLDVDYLQHVDDPSSPLVRCAEGKAYWTSPAYGFLLIPARDIVSNGDMFQNYSNKLSVLKLSCCTFNLPSSPFLCCHNLRFLWLDHCQVLTSDGAGEEKEAISRFFQRLWVLDVRYTKGCDQILSAPMIGLMTQLRELNVVGAEDWDVGQLQGGLPNICKLRVTESTLRLSCSEISFFTEMNKMEFLDFSRNTTEDPVMSLCGQRLGKSNISLERVVIDDCDDLEKVSFRGCIKLKEILLSGGLYDLVTLDISNTAVKILDLTQADISELEELYLLDCEKLCAIVWPPEDKRSSVIQKLRIDTSLRDGFGATRSSLLPALLHGSQVESEFDWSVSVRDARLLVSLEPVYPIDSSRKIYMEISSPTIAAGASKNEGIIKMSDTHQQEPVVLRLQQTAPALIYADITVDSPRQANDEGYGDAPGIMCMWPCPHVPHLPKESCYMHIQDQRGTAQSGVIAVPDFVIDCAKILHVRDSLSITVLPSSRNRGSEWHALEWCRIERCPKLDCVFAPNPFGYFWQYKLRILWVSQLPKAHYIGKWGGYGQPPEFPDLTSLHLDYCPRLIHIFPIGEVMLHNPINYAFQCLETLEIIWCGDLTEVFPLDVEAKRYQEQRKLTTLDFPKLKRIHLHELPKLHSICGHKLRMSAPELETVKIRGCWSLKRLPIVKKIVQCDCEKEWWDSLEWEDASQKKLYRPIHSKHFKKSRVLRRSVLR